MKLFSVQAQEAWGKEGGESGVDGEQSMGTEKEKYAPPKRSRGKAKMSSAGITRGKVSEGGGSKWGGVSKMIIRPIDNGGLKKGVHNAPPTVWIPRGR